MIKSIKKYHVFCFVALHQFLMIHLASRFWVAMEGWVYVCQNKIFSYIRAKRPKQSNPMVIICFNSTITRLSNAHRIDVYFDCIGCLLRIIPSLPALKVETYFALHYINDQYYCIKHDNLQLYEEIYIRICFLKQRLYK